MRTWWESDLIVRQVLRYMSVSIYPHTMSQQINTYIYIFFIYTYTYKTVIVLIITCYARDKYDIYTCGEYTNRYPEDPIGRFVAKAAQHRQNTRACKWFDNNLNSS